MVNGLERPYMSVFRTAPSRGLGNGVHRDDLVEGDD